MNKLLCFFMFGFIGFFVSLGASGGEDELVASFHIKGFKMSRTRCYCTAASNAKRFNFNVVKNAIYSVEERRDSMSLIYLGEKEAASYKDECGPVGLKGVPCWVRDSYAIFDREIPFQEGSSTFTDVKHSCKEQGLMMGADECEK